MEEATCFNLILKCRIKTSNGMYCLSTVPFIVGGTDRTGDANPYQFFSLSILITADLLH